VHAPGNNQVAILDATHRRVGLVPGWPVGYRPGGDELLVNDGGKLFIYAASSGAQLRVVNDAAGIQTAAYSSSGAVLATCAAGKITLRDALTWAVIGDFDTHRDDVTAIAVDDAGHIVTGRGDGGLEIWDAHGHEAIGKLVGHSAHIETMDLRGDRLVTTSWDRTTRAWRIPTGSPQGVQLAATGHTLAVSPSGQLIATVDRSALVSVWDAGDGRLLEQLPAVGALDAVAFSGDDHLAVGGGDGKLELIDLHERDRSTAELVRLAHAMQP
jgi:WD40 repeat protein